MAALAEGSWVWVPDEAEFCVPARALGTFERGKAATVALEDGREVALSAEQTQHILALDEQCLDGANVHDLITLSDLRAEALLHILRTRFGADTIYTAIGSILVSLNPFKPLPIFSDALLRRYLGAAMAAEGGPGAGGGGGGGSTADASGSSAADGGGGDGGDGGGGDSDRKQRRRQRRRRR